MKWVRIINVKKLFRCCEIVLDYTCIKYIHSGENTKIYIFKYYMFETGWMEILVLEEFV